MKSILKSAWLVWDVEEKRFLNAVYGSKKKACHAAAKEFGFDSYSEAKRKGWCEVIKMRQVECRRWDRSITGKPIYGIA